MASQCTQPRQLTRVIGAFALCAALGCPTSAPAQGATGLPQQMRFDWAREGPANECKQNCREWVSASGTITNETPQQFADFAKGRNLLGSAVVLESGGGNLAAAIWLGREFRRLGMATTVGKTDFLTPDSSGERRATLSPRGLCQSACPFVLLGGVLRHVPVDATILVHQIWPNQKREDAMAATYSAQEWVAEQRELGQLARYTIEMGGDISLFESALRVPPWEVLRPLTLEEVRRVGLDNVGNVFDITAVKLEASKPKQPPPPLLATPPTDNLKASSWETVQSGGVELLTRQYPLTLQGEKIGHFEISFACGREDYKVFYSETRRAVENTAARLTGVGIAVNESNRTGLAIGSSLRNMQDGTIDSIASGTASVAFVAELMRDGGQPLAVATIDSNGVKTTIIIGKAGLSASFKRFTANCSA